MTYNINFWSVPDWNRESSINPNFLMAVIVALFILVSFSWYTVVEGRKRHFESEKQTLTQEVSGLAPQADRLAELKEKTALWEEALSLLRRKGEQRIFWSRQLAGLQQLVPDHIVLTSLSIRDQTRRVEVPAAESMTRSHTGETQEIVEFRTVYTLHLEAVAEGENAEKKITDFARTIGNSRIIGELLTSYDIQNISQSEEREEDGKTITPFYLTFEYQEFPEFM